MVRDVKVVRWKGGVGFNDLQKVKFIVIEGLLVRGVEQEEGVKNDFQIFVLGIMFGSLINQRKI